MTVPRFLAVTALLAAATPAAGNPCRDMAAGEEVESIGSDAFVRAVIAGLPEPRRAGETPSAYEYRVRNRADAFLRENPYFIIRKPVLSTGAFAYDARAQELRYLGERSFPCGDYGERLCLNLVPGSERGRDGFDLSFVPPSARYDPYPPMKALPERARRVREGDFAVDLIVVVVPEPPFVEPARGAGAGMPVRRSGKLPVRVLCTGWSVRP